MVENVEYCNCRLGEYCENHNRQERHGEDDWVLAVDGRLLAYRFYMKGSVLWTHPSISHEVLCSQPSDIDNPNTFELPTFCKRKPTKHVHNDYIEEVDCWSWGNLHSHVERLFMEGWLCREFSTEVNA